MSGGEGSAQACAALGGLPVGWVYYLMLHVCPSGYVPHEPAQPAVYGALRDTASLADIGCGSASCAHLLGFACVLVCSGLLGCCGRCGAECSGRALGRGVRQSSAPAEF